MLDATVGAGAVKAAGAYEQGQATKNLMNYQAQAKAVEAQQTADFAKANISGVQDQAALTATMLRRRQAEQTGQQTAAEGAQGIGGSKTAGDIAKDTFTKQQLDQMTLQYNANVKSWGITNQANQKIWALNAESSQFSLGAKNAETAGNIATVGSILDTAAQVENQAIMMAK